jgi:hypothetical protein
MHVRDQSPSEKLAEAVDPDYLNSLVIRRQASQGVSFCQLARWLLVERATHDKNLCAWLRCLQYPLQAEHWAGTRTYRGWSCGLSQRRLHPVGRDVPDQVQSTKYQDRNSRDDNLRGTHAIREEWSQLPALLERSCSLALDDSTPI